mgnify:CR=1 FL=1
MQLSKKNIISSVVFLLGLVALLVLVSMFFRPKKNTEYYGMEEPRANGILSEPKETLDVFFVGDSIILLLFRFRYGEIMGLHLIFAALPCRNFFIQRNL